MTDMQHYSVMTSLLRPFDAANDAVVTPTFSDVVLAADAEAAIAAAVDDFREVMSESVWYQSGRECGYDEGQRDMLARCIAAVEALFPMPDLPQPIRGEVVIAALRALNPD